MRKVLYLILVVLVLFGLAGPMATPAQAQVAGDYRSAASGNWNTLATWQRYNGTSWVTPTAGQGTPTNASGVITIRNTHTVTVTAGVTVDQVTVDAGGQITVNSGITLTIANGAGTDMTVNGTLVNSGTITTTGTLAFGAGSTYQHNRNGGIIPTATWNATSTCLVTGVIGTMPTGFGQTFGNLTWNCTGQTVSNNPGSVLTVAGNLTIQSTGTGTFQFSSGTSTVTGSYSQTGGTIRLGGGSARTLSVSGNFSLSGGTFDMSGGSAVGTLNVAGIFSHTAGTITETSTGSGTIVFNGSGTQTYTSGGTVANTINFTVNSGATVAMASGSTVTVNSGATMTVNGTLDCGTGTAVSGAGTFTLANVATATLRIGSTAGITSSGATGNIQTTTRNFNSGANYIYNGTAAQVTGNGLPATVNNLTINNASGVTLTNSVTVNGTLALTSGNITTGINTVIIPSGGSVSGGSSSSYVKGNLRKNVATGPTSRTFEIGDTNYNPVTVAFGNVTTAGNLTAKATTAQHPNIGSSTINSGKDVNVYWTLTNAGIVFNNYSATFNFNPGDIIGSADTSIFIVGRYSAGWTYPTIGMRTPVSTLATGITSFGDFAVGEITCTITAPASVCANSIGNTASVPDAGGDAYYAWTIDNGGTITTGQGTRSITWTAGSTSPVTIGITVTKGGIQCTNSTQVTVIPIPDCTITAPEEVYANSIGNTASVPDAGPIATYTWAITNGTITAGQGTRSITWRAGTIDVTIGITIDVSGCQCTNSVVVTVTTPEVLSVDISGNLSFCPGASENLTANAGGGVPPYFYLWSTDATTQSIEITTPGTYSVTVTDSAACSSKIVSDTNTMVTQGNVPGTYPRNAVLAWVHDNWWPGLDYKFDYYTDNVTRWIWESYQVVNPVAGDVVYFERSFNIPSTPIGATLHVTCDNGYEVYMNDQYLGWAQLADYGGIPWEESNLTNNWVASDNWQTVEPYTVPAILLTQGENVLEIRAANEYSGPLDGGADGTVTSNPGAIIYDLVYEYYCTASDSIDITYSPTPTANFTAVPLSGPAPLNVQFTDTSTGSPTAWAWDFENNGSIDSYDQNPLHQYSSPDTYSVTLIVTNTYGCSADLTIPNYITVSEPATAPTVNSIEIYATQACLEPHVTAMDPLTTYYAKVSITTNGEQLNQLQTVQVILFYVSDNSTPPAPGIANTQTCAILSRTVGDSPLNWTIDAGGSTTWAIVPNSCSEPSNLNATTGDWIFAFTPGKVATESILPAHWDAQGKATNKSSLSGEMYVRNKAMNWYGEITVNTPSVDWGSVPLGLRFEDAPNPLTVSIKYIANGDYYEDIQSSATWQNPAPPALPIETVNLSSGDPPTNPGEFALMADDINVPGSAIPVTISYTHINDTNGLTTEDGITITDNGLWLSLSAAGILPVTYSGYIHYQIAER